MVALVRLGVAKEMNLALRTAALSGLRHAANQAIATFEHGGRLAAAEF